MQTTLVIIPTYNEVDNVSALLDKLIELAFDFDVLVVDDNSPDGTAALVAKYSEKYPQVKLCLRKKKMGLGSAYREGFAWALANRYDYVVQMDGDFSHSPEELPRLLKASQTSDITIGSRFCNGRSRKCEMNVYRYTLSRLANGYVRFFLGKQIHDWTSGYRVYRSVALSSLSINSFCSRGFIIQVEIMNALHGQGWKIVEVPISYRKRLNQKSKMSFVIIFEAFCRIPFWGIDRLMGNCKR